MHREPESTDKLAFFSNSTHYANYAVIEYATQVLLSDVFNCTNMYTDFIDFRKQHIVN